MADDNSVRFGRINADTSDSLDTMIEPLGEVLGTEFELCRPDSVYANAALPDGQTFLELAYQQDDEEPVKSHNFEIDVRVRALVVDDEQIQMAYEQRDALERLQAWRIYHLLVHSGQYRAIVYHNGQVAMSSHFEFDVDDFVQAEKFNQFRNVRYPFWF